MLNLENVFAKVVDAEETAIELFVHNPASQALAGVALVTEETLFKLIASLHATVSTSPTAPATPTTTTATGTPAA